MSNDTDTDVVVVQSDDGDTIVVEVFMGISGPEGPPGPAGPEGPPGPAGLADEVAVSPDDPGAPYELWYDPDATSFIREDPRDTRLKQHIAIQGEVIRGLISRIEALESRP